MSALSKSAAEVEHELGAAWTRYHVGAQAGRFAAGVAVALLLSLHNGFTNWTDLLPLLWGAVWITAAQMWPQVPWSLIRPRQQAADAPVTFVPPGGGPVVPGPGPAAQAAPLIPPSTTDPAPPPAKG